MSNFGYPNTSAGGPSPDFYSFHFQASPSNNSIPSEPNYYVPPSRYGGGTFQTIYGSFNSRMRRISDFEPVKHKRSRKGCFTCRSRRVKCDEVRPRCNRCRKGKRACVFPEEPSSPLEDPGKSTTDEQQTSGQQSASNEAVVLDEAGEGSRDQSHRSASSTSSHERALPSDNESPSSAPQELVSRHRIAGTLPDVKSYLDFFSNHVSHHHYGFLEAEKGSYLRSQLADHAPKDDALMYAIVAFTAYLVMVSRDEPYMEGFLDFYSSSMYMLRTSLQGSAGQRLSVTTLMTVLQLALLEEYLGDWVHLQAHKRAALSLITEMYTPTSMVQDPLSSILLEWYTRFDQFTAFMSKSRNSLSREWFEASCSPPIYNMGTGSNGSTMLCIRSEMSLRLLGKDVSTFFGAIETGVSGENDPAVDISSLVTRFEQWNHEYEGLLLDQARMPRQSFGEVSALPQGSYDPQDIGPGAENNKWPSKHLLVRFWTLELFFNQVAALLRLRKPTISLASQVRRVCSMLQDIASNDPHPDAILGISACLGIASLASRTDLKWSAWCLEKFSIIESRGYLYPSALRKLMPASGEQLSESQSGARPAIITAVQEWIEERSNHQLDSESANIREMAGIIGSIDMGDM